MAIVQAWWRHHAIGTLFELAKRGGWRGNGFRRGENTEARQDKTLSLDDFYCYMPLSPRNVTVLRSIAVVGDVTEILALTRNVFGATNFFGDECIIKTN